MKSLYIAIGVISFLIGIHILFGSYNNKLYKTVQCADGIHFCKDKLICTPDSKKCVTNINYCSDPNLWCVDNLVCTPDNKSCVTAVAICSDKIHWCVDGAVCTADNQRCWYPKGTGDTDLDLLPIVIPLILSQ